MYPTTKISKDFLQNNEINKSAASEKIAFKLKLSISLFCLAINHEKTKQPHIIGRKILECALKSV